jgi:hypothetical protein
MLEMLIGFDMSLRDNYPEYPENDSEYNYKKWIKDSEDFAKVEGEKIIRNNFPNIINIQFEEFDNDYIKFYCSFKERN